MEDLVADDEPTEREKRQVEEFARRKAKSRFYADENFPQLATAILRRLKADVLTVQANHRRGHPDENHAAEALRLGRVLITCDRDYLDARRFPLLHCPALVVCDFGRGTAGEIRDAFNVQVILPHALGLTQTVAQQRMVQGLPECSEGLVGSVMPVRFALPWVQRHADIPAAAAKHLLEIEGKPSTWPVPSTRHRLSSSSASRLSVAKEMPDDLAARRFSHM